MSEYLPDLLPIDRSELIKLKWPDAFGNARCSNSLNQPFRYVYTKCETFTEAIKPKYNIIMGRKGSGKSSLIKLIRLGDEYTFKIVCSKTELANWINKYIYSLLSESNMSKEDLDSIADENYVDACKYYYWLLIFREILKEEPKLKTVKSFLGNIDPPSESFFEGVNISGRGIVGRFKEWAIANIGSNNLLLSFVSLGSLFVTKKASSFQSAKEEALDFLEGKSLVILIDNKERYPFNSTHDKKAFGAFSLSAVEFDEGGTNIVVKCFIPSENYTQFHDFAINYGKLIPHVTFLRWNTSELFIMLCKRLAFGLYREGAIELRDLSVFNNIEEAFKFWHTYFPERVESNAFDSIEEPTFCYILRHTQSTPRQAIQLCNSIIRQANHSNIYLTPNRYIPDTIIRNGIKEWEKHLCIEVFSAFHESYPNAEQFCSAYLSGLNPVFHLADLKLIACERIPSCSKYKVYKDNPDLLRAMLCELDIIGIEEKKYSHPLDKTYYFAIFESSKNNRLDPNEQDTLLVHPMFIHKINFERDKTTFEKPICSLSLIESL